MSPRDIAGSMACLQQHGNLESLRLVDHISIQRASRACALQRSPFRNARGLTIQPPSLHFLVSEIDQKICHSLRRKLSFIAPQDFYVDKYAITYYISIVENYQTYNFLREIHLLRSLIIIMFRGSWALVLFDSVPVSWVPARPLRSLMWLDTYMRAQPESNDRQSLESAFHASKTLPLMCKGT